jgi:zinc protease
MSVLSLRDRGAMIRATLRLDMAVSLAVAVLFLFVALIRPAHAMKIESVKSPGGIEAWLVEEHRVPMLALRFGFAGGNSQDPAGKEGLANFITGMMDEGAGDLTSEQFQQRMEEIAMRMSFEDGKDSVAGNFETLTVNRDKGLELLKLALTKPRFDPDAIERVREQLQAGLVYAARDPEKVAGQAWSATAFKGHPYGRPANGTKDSIAAITRDDLVAFHKKTFAKSNLKVVAVGDITAADLGRLLDTVFGELPATAELAAIAQTKIAGGSQQVIEMNVPQSVAVFGLPAMARKDDDFMPAFVLNQILGGGGFASRLMEEVREKRGLAYGVYSYIQPYKSASIFAGSVATKNESIAQSLDVIRGEFKRMADSGPTETELKNAKSYLTGSYALRFDTNSKIASQLLGLLQDDYGIDYVEKRNAQVEAVTMADVKRVAAKLLKNDDLIVTIVGKPANLPVSATTAAPKG